MQAIDTKLGDVAPRVLRDDAYSLEAFSSDVTEALPELEFFAGRGKEKDDPQRARSFAAILSMYWLLRGDYQGFAGGQPQAVRPSEPH